MQKLLAAACLAAVLAVSLHAEESAAELESQGARALKSSQTTPDAILTAAVLYARAADAYLAKGDEAKATEMNSFLYWCKKKMTLQQMDAFIKGGNPDALTIAKRLADVEKAVPAPSQASVYFSRAENYAKSHPNEHLLIAVLFYEVADRFKGSDVSLPAQDRSLKEMLLAQKVQAAPEKTVEKIKPAPAEAGQKLPVPGAQELKQAEKFAREIYAADLAKTAPADKLALTRKLIAQADATNDDPTGKYELLILASQIAASVSELELVLLLGDKVAAEFDDHSHAALRTSLNSLIGLVREPFLLRSAMAYKTLLDKPDDPAACQSAGRFALSKGNFTRALPLLAISSHPVLSKIAQKDLAEPPTASSQAELGDSWWDQAEKSAEKEEKAHMQSRASFWYAKAAPSLTGLNKIRIEKRMKDAPPPAVEAIEVAAAPPAFPPLPAGSQAIDVLSQVDVENDSFIGRWKMENGALISPNIDKKAATILMPYKLPTYYRIDLELARVSGSEHGFIVCMLAGRNPFAFNLDDGKQSYLLTVDGQLEQPYKYNKTTPDATFADGPLIKDTKPHHLSVEFGRKAFTVVVDGRQIMNWKADYMRLGPSYWNRVSKQHLSLCARESVWRVTKVHVIDLEGTGEINHVDMRGVPKEDQ